MTTQRSDSKVASDERAKIVMTARLRRELRQQGKRLSRPHERVLAALSARRAGRGA